MTRALFAALVAAFLAVGASPVLAAGAPKFPERVAPAFTPAPQPVFLAASAPAPAPVVNVSVPEQPAPTVNVHTAPATQVKVTWGEWVSELAKIAAGLAAPLGLFFLTMVKGLPGVVLRAYLTEAKINELAGYAVNAVEGATKDRALTIDLGNEVLATAVRYANDTLPKKAIAALGGVEGIRAKVLAKLNIEAGANADALSA